MLFASDLKRKLMSNNRRMIQNKIAALKMYIRCNNATGLMPLSRIIESLPTKFCFFIVFHKLIFSNDSSDLLGICMF